MPQRKIMLSVGSTNYRPPLERSKSAPRLMVIEETGEEIDEEDDESNTVNEAPRRQCCTMDPLYPAMTLGRRRCKRGHSIRRTSGQRNVRKVAEKVQFNEAIVTIPHDQDVSTNETTSATARLRIGSDSGDDLDKLLLRKDYDSASPLADELMSYFDMKFSSKTTASMDDLQLTDEEPHYPAVRSSLSLDNLDSYSDDANDPADDDLFFSQDHILSTLIRHSKRASSMTQRLEMLNGDDEEIENTNEDNPRSVGTNSEANQLTACDSDEGSISSGFDTASTVTASIDVALAKSDAEINQNSLECSSVRTTPLATVKAAKPYRSPRSDEPSSDSDESDLSDESGYVEYQLDSLSTTVHSTNDPSRPLPISTAKSQCN